MAGANTQAKTRVEGEPHPLRDGRVWSVASQSYVTPGQTPASPTASMAPLPSATKQTAGVAGAGMGTGGKTYDSGLGAGGVKGMGDSPMKPVNTFRPGSLQWQRWEDTYNPKPIAPVTAPAPTPEAPPIEGAMTSAQMDAMQALPPVTAPKKDGDPGPAAGTFWSSKDNAYITPAVAASQPATTPETVQAAAVAAVNPQAALAPLPPAEIRYAGGTPSFNEDGVQVQNALPPLPSTVKPQEQLIADQDPNNPISNWQAIGRAVGAEYSPFTYSAADIANEARGFGLDRYLNPEQLAEEQIRLQGQQLDEKERRDMEDLRNRNGGIGISGNRLRREMEVANQYGLDKAIMQNDVRRQARGEGLNANLMVQGNARNVLGDRAAQQEGRFGTMLNSALQQSGQQTGIVQNERGRAWQGNENAAQRQWQTGETQAQRVHDAAVKDAENNQATRGMYTQILAPMLLDMINPKPKSPQDAWYEAQLAKDGVNVGGYDQFSQGGIPGLLNTILGGGGLEQILTAIPALQGLLQGGGY